MVNPKTNTINRRFKQTRKEAGLTQAEFAKELNISESSVKHIEIGKFLPTLDLVRRWSKKYNKPYGWIIDGEW